MSVSHLGHAERLFPDLAASKSFLTDSIGLQVSEKLDVWGTPLPESFKLGTGLGEPVEAGR